MNNSSEYNTYTMAENFQNINEMPADDGYESLWPLIMAWRLKKSSENSMEDSMMVRPKKADNDFCPICLDKFDDAEMYYIEPCSHEFHTTCITPWWQTNNKTCPVCRSRIVRYGRVKIMATALQSLCRKIVRRMGPKRHFKSWASN